MEDYVVLDEPEPPWLVESVIPSGGVVNLLGKPKKSRKSSAAISLCLALAGWTEHTPTEWLGFPVKRAAKSLYLQLDMARSGFRRRCMRLYEHGIEFPQGMCVVADRKSVPYPFNIMEAKHSGWLKRVVDDVRPGLVVVDTLRECYRGKENDNDFQQEVVATLRAACGDAAVFLISHAKKNTQDALGHDLDVMDAGRGGSYISGAMDTVMWIKGRADRTGTMILQGRDLDHTEVKLKANDLHMWEVDRQADVFQDAITSLLADASYPSDYARAKALAELSGKTLDACKKALQRVRDKH